MKIGVLGSGNVAQAVGYGLTRKGHEIFISSRDPRSEKVREWIVKTGQLGRAGTFRDAARFGEVILLAINPWTQIEGLLNTLDKKDVAGKVIIDPSNNIEFTYPPRLAFSGISMGEQVQKWLPESHVVKTLNIVPSTSMVDPSMKNIPPIQWVAGNHQGAKEQVTLLLHDLGWSEVFDLGDLKLSRLQESIGLLVTGIVMQLTAKK